MKNIRLPARRLRVRRVNEESIASTALAEALEKNRPVIRVACGGSVANSYSYPAETEGCVTVAWPDGTIWQRVERLPANKVSLGGVFAKITGYRGPFDDRFSDARKREVRKAFLQSISPVPV